MTNLLEPWVLLRLAAGLVSVVLFWRAAYTSQRVLRHFDVRRATEGQLALEKRIELAATFSRVAAVVQALGLVLSIWAADRLSHGVRGAMCAYGVFGAHPYGFRSLSATAIVALAAGIVTQLHAFDARVRSLDLARPVALFTCAMAPLAAIDFLLAAEFFLGIDLSVVASCCSVQLDAVTSSTEAHATGPRVLVTGIAIAAVLASIVVALLAARSPSRSRVIAAGVVSLLTVPAALAACVLEVAPHVFEVPTHLCPFCLLKTDVLGIGYPLFGAVFFAALWAAGAGLSAMLSRSSSEDALQRFAPRRLRLGAAAWAMALAFAAAPVARFALVTSGASLFP